MSIAPSLIESPDKPPTERNWWVYVILSVVCAVCIIPFLWIVLTAFMSKETAQTVPPQWFFSPVLDAFYKLIVEKGMLTFLFNSVIVASVSTALSVVIGMFCAYALARYEFTGKDDVSFWILTNRMMPAVAVVLPIYLIFQTLNLLGSRIGLIALYTGMQLPFVVWMLKGYFEDIPRQLEEAALVDGDTWFGSFRRVTLPMMAPSIVATAIFVLILSWNEFAFALFLTNTDTKTLPPAVVTYAIDSDISWNMLGAASLFITLPIIAFVIAVQKQFVRGLSMGAVR